MVKRNDEKVASILLLFVLLLCNVSLFSACFSEEPSVAQGEKGERENKAKKVIKVMRVHLFKKLSLMSLEE